MAKQKAAKKTRKAAATAPKTAAQEALEVTWVLKGHLKNAQISYIRVCVLLAKVRDKNLYKALHHPDMESYAEERLNLGRASLYRYLQVYDWIRQYHKEWLEPKPKGFIPELSDAADLIWIEKELSRKDLNVEKRAALEGLRQKAVTGKLRSGELNEWRRKVSGSKEQSLKSFLSKFRSLRMRCSQVKCVPAEVLAHIDSAIEIIKNALALQKAGLNLNEAGK